MKYLFLLRHAKSSWSDPGISDQQRPLNKRGRHDAPVMGSRLKERDECPDLILTSPAIRARDTAELFADASEGIVEQAELYFSSSGSIEDIIAGQDDQIQSLMLVFHNPDITNIANSVGGMIQIDNVPTCGLLKLACSIDRWSDWSISKTRSEYFDFPRKTSA